MSDYGGDDGPEYEYVPSAHSLKSVPALADSPIPPEPQR